MDPQAAIRFISSYGDPAEQAQLHFMMARQPAPQEAVTILLEGQRSDGGWCPFWAAGYSSLDATCFHLSKARQLGIGMEEPAIARAVTFLEERQASLGSWEEDAAVASLAPAWALPGDLRAQLYMTANCGYWMALLNPTSNSSHLASSFLLPHLQPSGQMPTFPHAHWLSAGLWSMLGQHAPAEIVCSYLFGQLQEISASGQAWMITTLCDAGLARDHELIQASLAGLAAQQQPDGRWISEDGPARDVHATLEALRAIIMGSRPPFRS